MDITAEISNVLLGTVLPILYLFYQLPLLLGALLMARRFSPRSYVEYLTAAGFLYAFGTMVIPGILGLFGQLTAENALIVTLVLGGAVWLLERGRPRLQLPPLRLSMPEILLLAVLFGFLIYQWRAYSCLPPIGTDALIYHLYYPAIWNVTGTVERLTQPGYMTSTYPCYGELIYAWQMLSFSSDFMAKNWQFFFIFLGTGAVISLVSATGLRRIHALGAGTVMAFSGVVFRNATVANTDIVTGAFLVLGVAFLLLGVRRNRTGWMLLAGAGFGMAAGTKYLGFMLAPPALLVLATAAYFYRPTCRKKLLWAPAAAVVVGSPCFIANWIVTGNPVFPTRIGIGEWTLFSSYMDLHAPSIGWTTQAWGYFVNTDTNNVNLANAVLLLLGIFAAIILPLLFWGKRKSFRHWAFPVLAGTVIVLLAIQLQVYPSITQPRQIIPLAMLAAVCIAWPLEQLGALRVFRSEWSMAALIAVLLWLVSAPQLRYQDHGMWILFFSVLGGVLLLGFSRLKRRSRIAFAVLVLAIFSLDSSYRHGVSRNVASSVRAVFVSAANEEVRQIILQLTGDKGARIAYSGAYFYHFCGDNGQNILLNIPISASGKPDNHDYHSLEEMRTPGSYELWLSRLREAKANYLLIDRHTFAAPNPEQERKWALAHPEVFARRFEGDGLTLFQIREAR